MTKKKQKEPSYILPSPSSKKIDSESILKEKYPIFCFKYLNDISIKKCKDYKFFFDFLMRLQKLSGLGWDGIRMSSHHSYGMEKIPVRNIKPKLPDVITPDIEELDVFRANGNKLPFVGIQIQNIFRILFIETEFGDIYDHGSK
jgi:hypothetical protein